jgi:ubiquinone/menaquinone biosynthesis C-methylase UbiE
MATEKRDFNKEAAKWDENPGRVKMTEKVYDSIMKNIKPDQNMEVMDFGCGTGLLSLKLLPHVKSVTAVDSSHGMLEVLDSKIQSQKLSGIKTVLADIDRGDKLTGSFDLVTSSMTMHHIENIPPLFAQFFNVIKPGGFLCITDLDPDGGLFHESSEGVFHEGFQRDEMKRMFTGAGFVNVQDDTVSEINKPGRDGEIRGFSIFLIKGEKK